MELSNRALLVIQVATSLVAWAAVALVLFRPALARLDRRRALRWVLAPQMFRHLGMTMLATGVPGSGLPPSFAAQVATGDLITTVLAIAAFVALGTPGRIGIALAGAATFVGAADLVHNLVTGVRLGVADHLGATWPVVAIVVPGMLVLHALAIDRLRVRGTS
jgi:hypothetical protein